MSYKRAVKECIKCASNTSVVDTRIMADGTLKRKRTCPICGHTYHTIELSETEAMQKARTDGKKPKFNFESFELLDKLLLDAFQREEKDRTQIQRLAKTMHEMAEIAGFQIVGNIELRKIGVK